MTVRQRRCLLVPAIVLVFGLLLAATLILPGTVFSAPLAQDTVLNLNYGDKELVKLISNNESEIFEPWTCQVNVPPGAELSIWVGEDSQGGCWWDARLYIGGNQVDFTCVGPDPETWSDPIVRTISGGSAQVEVAAGTSCQSGIDYPVYVYVYFEVSGSPPPEATTPPPSCQPQIEFWADRDHILRGECTTLHWDVGCVNTVHYQGDGVPGEGYRQECPQQTTTYELCVKTYEGEQICQQVTVYVDEPIMDTPTPHTPTTTPTPRPPTYTPTPRTPTPTRGPTLTPTPTCPDYYEPNDGTMRVWFLEEGGIASYICTPDDVDYFGVKVGANEELEIRLINLPANYSLELLASDGSGHIFAGSYHSGTQDERVIWWEKGYYYIKITSAHGGYSDEVPYSLQIRKRAIPTPTYTPTPTRTPTPTPTSSTMPPYLILTHIGNLNRELRRGGSGTWADVMNLLNRRYGNHYLVLDYEERLRTSTYDFHQAYDVLMEDVRRLGQPRYVIIIGGPDVVPFAVFHNACFAMDPDEDEFILSDDLYGDFVHEAWHLPEAGVARIPDGGDFKLIEAIFRSNDFPQPTQHDVFVLAQPYREWAGEMVMHILAGDVTNPDARNYPLWSAPNGPSNIGPAQTNARWSWYMLHGNTNTRRWTGEDPSIACTTVTPAPSGPPQRQCPSNHYPEAITINEARSNGLVISSACYGAFISHQGDLSDVVTDAPKAGRTASNSIALRFLREGAIAFIGHTSVGYSLRPDISEELQNKGDFTIFIPPSNLDGGQQHFVALVFEKVAWFGWHPLDAFRQAKFEYLSTLYPGPGVPRCGEMKAQNDFVYYGLPPTP